MGNSGEWKQGKKLGLLPGFHYGWLGRQWYHWPWQAIQRRAGLRKNMSSHLDCCLQYLENILGEMSNRQLNIRIWNAGEKSEIDKRFGNWQHIPVNGWDHLGREYRRGQEPDIRYLKITINVPKAPLDKTLPRVIYTSIEK